MRPFLRTPIVRSPRPTPSTLRHTAFISHRPILSRGLRSGRSFRAQDASSPHPPEAQEETVHISRPFFTFKRTGYLVFCIVVAYSGASFLNGRLGKLIGDIDPDALNAEEDKVEGDEESVFIPCQWPQRQPRSFYKQSDADWQEFVRISNDEGRANTVREELANRCLRDVASAPKLQHMLGSNISLGQYWLDLKYPDRPPPEYTRSGIEISDDYVAWSTQTIPHSHYVQLKHIMYPTAIFAAAFNSVTIFSHLQWIKVKGALGLEFNMKDKQVSAVSKIEKGRLHMEAMQAELDSQKDASAADKQKLLDQLKSSKTASDAGAPPPQAPKPSPSTQTDPPSSSPLSHPLLSMLLPTFSSSNADDPSSNVPHPVLELLRPSTDMTLAWKMFISTLQMSWRKSRLDTQPKGAFFIVGQIEVRGERGRIRCDVQAAYDPKSAKVVYCICQVKHFWEWRQRAKGGP